MAQLHGGQTHRDFHWETHRPYDTGQYELWTLLYRGNHTKVVVEGYPNDYRVALDTAGQDSSFMREDWTVFATAHKEFPKALEHGELVYAGFFGSEQLQQEISANYGRYDESED